MSRRCRRACPHTLKGHAHEHGQAAPLRRDGSRAQAGRRPPRRRRPVTLGPKGRNVVLDKKYGSPTITNDGVTIARDIELDDPFENMGAQLLKEVATKTDDVAGDGTTTAIVLGQAIVAEGLQNVSAGANPMGVKRGIEKGVEAIVAELKRSRARSRSTSRSRPSPRSARPIPRSARSSPR